MTIISGMFMCKVTEASSIGVKRVADYDKRIKIWDKVAGNSSRSKLDDMNIDKNRLVSNEEFAKAIVGDKFSNKEKIIDTFTYLYEIKGGYEKETYEDEPYLIPYLVDSSDEAVIIIPGGGYGYKSMDGGTEEGKDVAYTLNKNGISAFVLHYRSNPYEYPIPQLDVQRAIRYLKYHSFDYGINPDKIGLIGFSAGGTQVGCFINKIRGKDLFPEGYITDEIDKVSDTISNAAMIYPVLDYYHNIPMLFSLFNDKEVRNKQKRIELLKEMDLKKYITSEDIPQLVAYGTNDSIVGSEGAKSYINIARKKGTNVKEISVEGGGHGFSQECYMNEFLRWFKTMNKKNI
ncbi:MAG TPA: alpha/beta hydrolase [Clostridium sp.]|nr:alpha/beta hydrolase [Clostridium sp.]